jgi:ribosomal-protein-alanine N-acetyltransferase
MYFFKIDGPQVMAPNHWNKGIATSICKSAINWGFHNLDFVRIQGTVLSSNLASEKLLTKCDFCYEGVLRSYRIGREQARDYKMYSILKLDTHHTLP